jgi:pyridinium-3,5-bisthiocarboxylic acid mononucleotide nickel chelatase
MQAWSNLRTSFWAKKDSRTHEPRRHKNAYALVGGAQAEMTMRTAYFDCFSGISGDMTIGALIDAGLSFEDLCAQLALLNVRGYELSVEKVKKRGFGGTKFHVRVGDSEPHHRGLHDIEAIIHASVLDTTVQERTLAVFTRLAEAEAAVHQSTVDRVHFHEVGAIDAIVDITGAVIGLHLLGIQRILASPINVGSGFVRAAHGVLPVPAPGTAELLKGIPTYARGTDGELTTPTGAALITMLAESFGTLPLLRIDRIGYGAGTKELSDAPNLLRVFIGEDTTPEPDAQSSPEHHGPLRADPRHLSHGLPE